MSAEPVEVVPPWAPPLQTGLADTLPPGTAHDHTAHAAHSATRRAGSGPRDTGRPSLLRLPGCYPVQADTWLLADTMSRLGLAAGASVLDLCTGTGALAVAAARAGAAEVTAIDISLRSAANAWLNAKRHGASVRVLRGDLFAPLDPDERFDLVVSNPPYVPSGSSRLPRHTSDRCWDGGPDGRMLLDRIGAEAFGRLRPGGSLLLVQSAVAGESRSVLGLRESGFAVEVVRRESEPFGPVMRSRAEALRRRGLIDSGQADEELVVIRAVKVGAAADRPRVEA